jgi:AhpD family alkylhydroperoxidase
MEEHADGASYGHSTSQLERTDPTLSTPDADGLHLTPVARVTPGTREELGRVNFALARLLGALSGGGPPNVFTTLARHRGLFRPWLRFAGALMPGGLLPRAETELLILRVAENCGCEYEWEQHERFAREAGLTDEQIQRVRRGSTAEGWSERSALLLRAADELHVQRTISDPLWTQLSGLLSTPETIELCMLVGHYEMLAMTLNTLGVQPDAPSSARPPHVARLLQRAVRRRRGAARSEL